MTGVVTIGAVTFWAGAALVLSQVRWFDRSRLSERLRPYTPGGLASAGRPDPIASSLRGAVAPLARRWGKRVARLFGVEEDAGIRLSRIHSPLDVTTFRLRQVARVGLAFAGGVLLVVALRPPLAIALLLVAGGPTLAFLLVESSLAQASARWQRRIFLELPVVSEQLGMLIGAGYSLGGALNRIARRGSGACATDLARVGRRIRQGLTEVEALREWAATTDVDALSRLVAVLALNRDAGDLGRLIADESRTLRREAQRQLIEEIERRSQQVWIPVTVATLVPGAMLLAVPFIEAMRLFSSA